MGRPRIAGKNFKTVNLNLDYDDFLKFEEILYNNQSASEVIREFIRTRIEEHELEKNLKALTQGNAIGIQYFSASSSYNDNNKNKKDNALTLDIVNFSITEIIETIKKINDTDILLRLENKSRTIMKVSNKLRTEAINFRIYQNKLLTQQQKDKITN